MPHLASLTRYPSLITLLPSAMEHWSFPMKKHATVLAGLIMLASLMLAGCASTSPSPAEIASFYGGNPPTFQPGPSGGVDRLYTKPGMNLSKYRYVMVDEVQFFLRPEAAGHGLQASDVNELANSFHKSLFAALGDAYPVVSKPGPDVLRIRLALTNVEISKPVRNIISTVTPIGLAVSVGKKAATGSSPGVGGASMEVELVDSMTGERLAAAIDTFNATKVDAFTKLGAAEEAFSFWSKRLRITLDKAHGKAAK